MAERIGIFVDAGYLLQGAGEVLAHGATRIRRSDITTHVSVIGRILRTEADRLGVDPDAKIGWYDGFRTDMPLRRDQRIIASDPDFVFRGGPMRERHGTWTQKRVDGLIQRDMVRAAACGLSDIMLVAGDEDLTVAVDECSDLGTRVHVYGIESPRHTTSSPYLRMACEDERMLKRQDISTAFSLKTRAGIGQVAAATIMAHAS